MALHAVFSRIDGVITAERGPSSPNVPARLHSLLSTGVDLLAVSTAARLGWELVAPLPFGKQLNLAINALPKNFADATALLSGANATDLQVQARAAAISHWYERAKLFELADRDAPLEQLFLQNFGITRDGVNSHTFSQQCSERAALAARIVIEQSDLLIAVWDGTKRGPVGGTSHTVKVALECGVPVLWINSNQPNTWRLLRAADLLSAGDSTNAVPEDLDALVRAALRPLAANALHKGVEVLGNEAWRPRSSRLTTAYRRIEALFGGESRPFRSLVQKYESPEQFATGSGADFLTSTRSLIETDPDFVDEIERRAMRPFAWADGISSRLSDHYRGGMIANFLLSSLAVAAGLAYLPLGLDQDKWQFAVVEFLLLSSILLVTWIARSSRWHKRWLETRRVAEYFRHAPILLLLGVARPVGRWPKGIDTDWPEFYARQGLRAPGLPRAAVTVHYLRQSLSLPLREHTIKQRNYHVNKARRLANVHHRLDRLSQWLFVLAVGTVSIYLILKGAAVVHLVPAHWPPAVSKLLTFLGVMFPTLGASVAGMRYFGEFERFAAISDVTANKLTDIVARIDKLLAAPDMEISYEPVAEIAHAIDDVIVSEIENWQAVFGGKHFTVPV
jgi:hypothetical protein